MSDLNEKNQILMFAIRMYLSWSDTYSSFRDLQLAFPDLNMLVLILISTSNEKRGAAVAKLQ